MSFIKLECQSFKWARFGTIADLYCYLHQYFCFGLRQNLVGVAVRFSLVFLWVVYPTSVINRKFVWEKRL